MRLCVPLIQVLRARNWNSASSGAALTASSVANSVGTSTPLRAGRIAVWSCSGSSRLRLGDDDAADARNARLPRTFRAATPAGPRSGGKVDGRASRTYGPEPWITATGGRGGHPARGLGPPGRRGLPVRRPDGRPRRGPPGGRRHRHPRRARHRRPGRQPPPAGWRGSAQGSSPRAWPRLGVERAPLAAGRDGGLVRRRLAACPTGTGRRWRRRARGAPAGHSSSRSARTG